MAQKHLSGYLGRTPAAAPPPHRSPDVFYRAVEILKTKHHVNEALAYAMLVQDAVHAGVTLRESAAALIAETVDTPKPSMNGWYIANILGLSRE